MEAQFSYPIANLSGCFGGYSFYQLNGKTYLRRMPKPSKNPPTEKQLKWREEFAKRYARKSLF